VLPRRLDRDLLQSPVACLHWRTSTFLVSNILGAQWELNRHAR
jgi:hypothetical protein